MSKTDPLEKFRRKTTSLGQATPYAAYTVSNESQRHLEIRQKFPLPATAPNYAYLRDITGEWRYGNSLSLFYSHPMQVIIEGRNLTELFRALQKGKVEWIQEFDPEEWSQEPTDPQQAVITSITIHKTRPEEPPPPSKRH